MVGIVGRELRLVSGKQERCQGGPKIELKAEASKLGDADRMTCSEGPKCQIRMMGMVGRESMAVKLK